MVKYLIIQNYIIMVINHIPTKFHCPITGDLIFSENSKSIQPSKATLFIEYPDNDIKVFDDHLKLRVQENHHETFSRVNELIGKEPQVFTFYQDRMDSKGNHINISIKVCIDMAYKNDDFERIN